MRNCKLIGGGHYGSHLGCRTKQDLNKINPYMKFGGNRVINDYAWLIVHKSKLIGGSHFVGHLGYSLSD